MLTFTRPLVQSSLENKRIVDISIILFWHFGDITINAGPANEWLQANCEKAASGCIQGQVASNASRLGPSTAHIQG